MARLVDRVLVVEDDRRLLRTLEGALSARFAEVRGCRTVAEAAAVVDGWSPDLLIVDFQLPDGDARAVLDLAALREPAPVVIAVSGAAGPVDTFELAHRGVRVFLPKPLTLDELEQAITVALDTAPDLEPHLRQAVGHLGLSEVSDKARDVMIDEALTRAQGSRRAAAKILGTSRQLLQYLLRRR
jgi:two-component system, response regulator RegA